ncbi:nucleotidyltransferase family protein [Sphingomonas sp. BN140010]|uniref:Nucleotidyltransferase family protein n=1 Tax=Sphingomonas arvum TaxID=2992113 RepID=A0ABT3JE86_9SPHN|nr:nucleotidyltransferase family protein [Sphingomonas sp. BN140010]MCW3797080.1 nucleotidyltransferase family protein [Sphingomonas sp. BN140010]
MTIRKPVPSEQLRWLAAACLPGTDRLAAPPGGWDRLPRLAERHRIGGLLWRRLAQQRRELPPAIGAALKREAQATAATNLHSAAECRRLAIAFGKERLPLLFVKGLTLSRLAYGDALVKMSRDIDLLVLPHDVGRAAPLLLALGYRPELPADPRLITAWHRRSKESVWRGPGNLLLELHSRLNDNPRVMAGVTAATPARLVEVAPGLQLPTLPEPELLAYLAVHGASSAWFRLKWLADFANLLLGRGSVELAGVHARMLALGCGRAGSVALLLASELFDLPLATGLEADWATRRLSAEAIRQMELLMEPTDRRLGTAGIHLSQLLIGNGLAFPLRESWRRVAELVGRRLMTG